METLIQGIKQLLVIISVAVASVFSPAELPADPGSPTTVSEQIVADTSSDDPATTTMTPVAKQIITDTSSDDPAMVTIFGEKMYKGKGVDYTMSFPEAGGPIQGEFHGLCNGSLDGKYEGGDSEKNKVYMKGKCKVASVFKKSIEVTYTGTINVHEGTASGDWKGNFPFKDEGSVHLTFKVQ